MDVEASTTLHAGLILYVGLILYAGRPRMGAERQAGIATRDDRDGVRGVFHPYVP